MKLAEFNKLYHFQRKLKARFNIEKDLSECEKISSKLFSRPTLLINKKATRSVKNITLKNKRNQDILVYVIYDEVFLVPCTVVPPGVEWEPYVKRNKKYNF